MIDEATLTDAIAHGGERNLLSVKDLVLGTALAMVMGTVFVKLGGRPLLVTFVPGLMVSWLLFARIYSKREELPEARALFPIYFLTLAWQFIHFAEEYLTGFYSRFPELYGSRPFSIELFVTFNMVSYFVFTIAFLLAFTKSIRFMMIPVLFFIVYGAAGNAISHTWWVIWTREYFPGFFTAQVYWLLGPLALSQLINSKRDAIIAIALFAVVFIPLLTLFIDLP